MLTAAAAARDPMCRRAARQDAALVIAEVATCREFIFRLVEVVVAFCSDSKWNKAIRVFGSHGLLDTSCVERRLRFAQLSNDRMLRSGIRTLRYVFK